MNFSALHEKLNQYINKGRLKSPWVVHYDCGSCNGCDIEVLACLTPVFDVERFGIVNIGDPKHADVLLVTGTVNQRNKDVLKNLYDQMPEPKAVIAIGACATTAGIPGMAAAGFSERPGQVYDLVPEACGDMIAPQPVGAVIDVDFEVRTCPVDSLDFIEVMLGSVCGEDASNLIFFIRGWCLV